MNVSEKISRIAPSLGSQISDKSDHQEKDQCIYVKKNNDIILIRVKGKLTIEKIRNAVMREWPSIELSDDSDLVLYVENDAPERSFRLREDIDLKENALLSIRSLKQMALLTRKEEMLDDTVDALFLRFRKFYDEQLHGSVAQSSSKYGFTSTIGLQRRRQPALLSESDDDDDSFYEHVSNNSSSSKKRRRKPRSTIITIPAILTTIPKKRCPCGKTVPLVNCKPELLKQGIYFNYCETCGVWVDEVLVIDCYCRNFEPPNIGADQEIKWLMCDICNNDSHQSCYPGRGGPDDIEPFICLQCQQKAHRKKTDNNNNNSSSSNNHNKNHRKPNNLSTSIIENARQWPSQHQSTAALLKNVQNNQTSSSASVPTTRTLQHSSNNNNNETSTQNNVDDNDDNVTLESFKKQYLDRWKCEICGLRCDTRKQLRNHVNLRHRHASGSQSGMTAPPRRAPALSLSAAPMNNTTPKFVNGCVVAWNDTPVVNVPKKPISSQEIEYLRLSDVEDSTEDDENRGVAPPPPIQIEKVVDNDSTETDRNDDDDDKSKEMK